MQSSKSHPRSLQLARLAFAGLIFTALAGTCLHGATASPPAPTPKTSTNSTAAPADPKAVTPVATVQTKPVSTSPFQFDIGVPAWASAISGNVGVKGVSGHIYQSFTSLWDHMDAVIPLTMDARYEKWGFHVDGQYVKLQQNFETRGVLYNSGDLTLEQAFCNFNLNYRFLDNERWKVEASIGGRYQYVGLGGTLTSKFAAIPNRDETGDVSWVDPIIGTNAKVHIYKPFSLLMLGDVGGFGVGSHLTYQFYGGGEVQIARHFYMDLGYRYLYTDYSKGGNTYEVDMSGPQITFGANF